MQFPLRHMLLPVYLLSNPLLPSKYLFFHIQVPSFFIPSVFQKVLVPIQLSLTPPNASIAPDFFVQQHLPDFFCNTKIKRWP